jgi:hypothetical protein
VAPQSQSLTTGVGGGLRSNRSAAFLQLLKVQKALTDADMCIKLKPEWEKVRPEPTNGGGGGGGGSRAPATGGGASSTHAESAE